MTVDSAVVSDQPVALLVRLLLVRVVSGQVFSRAVIAAIGIGLQPLRSRSMQGLKRLCHDLVSPLRGSLVVPLGARAYAHA